MSRNQHVVDSALIFALVGPALMWAVGFVYLLIFIPSPGGSSPSSWLSPYVAMLAFLSLVSVYVAVIGPAMAVGAAFGWAHGRFGMSSLLAPLVAFSLGFGVGFIAAEVVELVGNKVWLSPAAVGLAAGLSALVSALVTLRRWALTNHSSRRLRRGLT